MGVQVNLRLSEELLAQLDGVRGDVPRNRWLVRAVERALSDAKEPVRQEQADPGSVPLKGVESSEGVRSVVSAQELDTAPVGMEYDASSVAVPERELSRIELAERRRLMLAGAYRPPKK